MKRKISKEEFEKLSDVMKAEYQEKNGHYFAKIEDDDEALEALERAKKNEVDSHKETKAALKKLQDQLEEIQNEGSRKKGDVEALENSWKKKFGDRETELTKEIEKLSGIVNNSLRDSALTTLASKLVKPESHRLFKKSIEERLITEIKDGVPTLRILDPAGKPSALTIEDLEKEIVANKEYAPIIITSRASGGAEKPSRSGAPMTQDGKPINLASLTPTQLAAHLAENKGE